MIDWGEKTGCRIPVVRVLWEHADWVQFPAPRLREAVAPLRRGEGPCGCRITVLPDFSKVVTGVRLPLPAQNENSPKKNDRGSASVIFRLT